MIAVVIGGGSNASAEFNALPEYIRDTADIYCCNDSGTVLPRINCWCSLHPDQFCDNEPKWIQKRLANGLSMDGVNVVGYNFDGKPGNASGVNEWTNRFADGSSGMFAVGAAFDKGIYSAIICCGIPMDSTINPYLKRPSFKDGKAVKYYHKAWLKNLDRFRGIVFSQGGWTKEILGEYKENKGTTAGNTVSE